jgi:hypothetical protein
LHNQVSFVKSHNARLKLLFKHTLSESFPF